MYDTVACIHKSNIIFVISCFEEQHVFFKNLVLLHDRHELLVFYLMNADKVFYNTKKYDVGILKIRLFVIIKCNALNH